LIKKEKLKIQLYVFEKYLGNDSPVNIPSSILFAQEGIDLLRNNNEL